MMNKKQFLVTITLLLFGAFSIQAQSQNQQPLPLVNYKKNVDNPLSFSEKKMLQEVYADKLDAYILSRPKRLKDVKDILRNRIKIIEIVGKDLSGFKKLSDVALFNHYNSNLKRDAFFNKATFNPLKYQFSFHSRHGEYIRVDNTNYVIKINSQHQR